MTRPERGLDGLSSNRSGSSRRFPLHVGESTAFGAIEAWRTKRQPRSVSPDTFARGTSACALPRSRPRDESEPTVRAAALSAPQTRSAPQRDALRASWGSCSRFDGPTYDASCGLGAAVAGRSGRTVRLIVVFIKLSSSRSLRSDDIVARSSHCLGSPMVSMSSPSDCAEMHPRGVAVAGSPRRALTGG